MNYRPLGNATPAISRLDSVRIWFAVLLPGHLIREIARLPLRTPWRVASWIPIAVALARCTAGDRLIGVSALTPTMDWPQQRFAHAARGNGALGVPYAVQSGRLTVAT